MSLTALPHDTLSQIVAHLAHRDRVALRAAHPSLRAALSPANQPLWHDVHARRFRRRPDAPPLASPPDWHHAVALRDAADDYFIHKTLPFRPVVHAPAPAVPHIAYHRAVLHAACGKLYTARTARKHPRPVQHLEADATALGVHDAHVAVGLASGAVHQPHTSRTIRGHKGPVTALALTPGLLISGSADKTIRVRHPATRRTHATLRGHDAPVEWLHPHAHHLLSHGRADARVKLWDLSRAACLATARPGPVVDAAVHAACVYAATRSCVHVLDARAGLATVAVLSLPRAAGWQNAGIARLALAEDGALAAAVGGGGVAIWDAHGGWVARGLGWARRWEGREGRRLKALLVTARAVVTGGGARELLAFAREGGYEGVIAEDGVRRGAVTSLLPVDGGFLAARSCGRVDFADVRGAVADWEVVERVVAEESGRVRGFWDVGSLT